jgi:hypothetical protein
LTDDISLWRDYNSETQGGALQLVSSDNGALKAELWNSTSGWKTINSPLISADYSNWYRWELQIKGENTYNVHIKIAEYNQEQEIIDAYRVKGIDSGNFDWTAVTFDYTPENPETKYIQLQVWHGHETLQPLPNTIWIDNVKVYDLKKFVEPLSLEIPFTVAETGEYVFLTRLFQNQQGGKIQFQLSNENYTINTKDQLNKFAWVQIDTLHLQQGQHKMTLTNLEGFNAINLFALVPKQQYLEAQSQLMETLQNKRLIYVLEAENDFYHVNAVASNKYGGDASNGAVLELPSESEVWNELEILKAGNYTFAIRGKGDLIVTIDGKTYQTSSSTLDMIYVGPIALKTGTHKLAITYPTTYYAKWTFEDGEPLEWTGNSPQVQTLTIDENLDETAYEERCSLKVELTASTSGWKTINSPLIPVNPEIEYS